MNTDEQKKELLILLEEIQEMQEFYSISSSNKLNYIYTKYKIITKKLSDNGLRVAFDAAMEFNQIETRINFAINGTPKKEASSSYIIARQNIKDDIEFILSSL